MCPIFALSVLSETLLECIAFVFFVISQDGIAIMKVVLGVSTLSFKHKKLLKHCLHFGSRTNRIKMTSLTAKDKDTVRAFWAKVDSKKEDIGVGALCRCV